MLGAIYGDKAGSIYEFGQLKEITSIDPKELILPNSFYSDDTIETIAVIDAIINNRDYEQTLREYILDNIEYKPNFKPYFKNSFSPGAIKWAKGIGRNNSSGNGAMMRISPVGYLFNSEKDVIENARLVTITSHNSKEAIESATIIALIIFYFRKGLTKEEVFQKLNLLVKYESFVKFNTTCRETLGNCLYAIYNSNSFEDSIRKTLLMGGDTDTNCCIVGSVTESLYGMNDIQKKDAISNLPKEYVKVLKKVYE
ncbi:MAG: ADP-ribosylglycohydrolase family protein [Bacilli bacterium]|nr:ADP-ribosylglycohydrolase family protein [Bacilli bacterium]